MHRRTNRRPTTARSLPTVFAFAVLASAVLAPPAALATDADAEATEGNTMAFTVTLPQAPVGGCGVKYKFKTEDGSAVAGDDYTSTSGTITFSSGESQKTLNVTTLTDDVSEDSETFTLKLYGRVFTGSYYGSDCEEVLPIGMDHIYPDPITLTGKINEATGTGT